MDQDTARQFLQLLRRSGLYSPDQLAAGERAIASGGDPSSFADRLGNSGLFTPYQVRKAKLGRMDDLSFGPYLILEKIGEGGMGKVYKAFQTSESKLVALKVVRPHLMSNQIVKKRYKREAAAVAALDHPNIVALYDADEIEGRYFLAMEYVDGVDFSRLVRTFGNPPTIGLTNYQEAAEYIRQASLGLQHAHARGLIHRDIKPSNLMVFGDRALPGSSGKATVKILDMGLVRSMIEDEEFSRTELTRDGTVVGTPDYMAPEQAKNSSTVDPRADLYALGCTLFFLLRGRPPFPDGSPIDKLLRHQLDPSPNLREGRPEIPVGLAAVYEKLLKKNPAERYQTAAELAAALVPFTPSGEAVAAQLAPAAGAKSTATEFSFDPPEKSPMPVQPPSAATNPAKPAGVRLRIAQPPAASSAPAKLPTPTSVPGRTDGSPSSGSLPGTRGGTTPSGPASTPRVASKPVATRPSPPPPPVLPISQQNTGNRFVYDDDESGPTYRRSASSRRRKKNDDTFPLWAVITAVGVVALLLIITGVLLSRNRRNPSSMVAPGPVLVASQQIHASSDGLFPGVMHRHVRGTDHGLAVG